MNLSPLDHIPKLPALLGRLSLRKRLAVAFATLIFAAITLALTSFIAVNFSARQADQLEYANSQLEFVNALSIAVNDLQLATARYVHYGHESAKERVSLALDLWNKRIDTCEVSACLDPEHIRDLRVHLNAFDESFLLVATAHQEISDTLNSEFGSISNFASTHDSPEGIEPYEETLLALYVNSFEDHLAAIGAHLFAYFVTSDAQRVRDAEADLAKLKAHAALADAARRSILDAPPLFLEAAQEVEEIEKRLYGNIQKIRSYTYLVNVVMPSEASELGYLAAEIADSRNLEIGALRADMHQNRITFYRWQTGIVLSVLLLSIPVFFWVVSSVTSPLKQLAEVFRKLSEGSEEDIVGSTTARDEIGDLFIAAEAFRRENIRERQLLTNYKELSESLEAQVAERTHDLDVKNKELDRLASMDKLTDTYNRRALDEALAAELHRTQRYDRPFAILLMDIDLFKEVNDQHGHLTGDRVLVTLAQQIKANIRASDLLGRWGGEEFLVICPETDLEQARNVAEKVRSAIEATDFGLPGPVTISIGAAIVNDDTEASTSESLVAEADRALYLAKNQGRNRVCLKPMKLPPGTG